MAEIKDILVPDIGDFDGVEVIEIMVATGDSIDVEDPIVSLESDKAAMEIPSPFAGTVKEIKVNLGDKVSEGNLLITIEASEGSAATEETASTEEPETSATEAAATTPAPAAPTPAPQAPAHKPSPTASIRVNEEGFSKAHASPSVRKFARELGADLSQITGSGIKNRILKEDVKTWVKQALTQGTRGGGLGVEPMPEIDFSQFGEIEIQELTRINKLTGKFLHRN